MNAERAVCLLTLVMSGVCLSLTFSFPQISADPGGMALFPRIAGVAAALAALIILVRSFLSAEGRASKPSTLGSSSLPDLLERIMRNRMVWMIAASIIYPWLIIKLGFLIATTIYVFLLMKLFKAPLTIAGPYAVTVATGLYVVFVYILEAYVPPGTWLEGLGM